MNKYLVNITAQSIYNSRDIVERDYEVEAESEHKVAMMTLDMFWKEVNSSTYTIIDQMIIESEIE
jgi:hypothetical protein